MTLTELRYIVALHQTQHFGKAAEKCFVSQPTLSVAIKKLEESLDVVLFERSRQQVRATSIGEKIIQQAQLVLEQASVIADIASIGKDPLGSTFSVGAIFTIGPYLFPQLVPQLRKIATHMPLFIEENYTAVLREKLRNGELDAIIVALPFDEPDVVTKPLYQEDFVIALPQQHALNRYDSLSSKQLNEESVLLLGAGHCFREQVLAACPNLNKQHSGVIEGSSLETLKYMVASGLGISILPASAAQLAEGHDDGPYTVKPFTQNSPNRKVAVAWRASFPRPQAIEALCDAIKHCHLALH
ncbi:hydrogen peroxide-inducible genes activator [Dasania marina]|uniref:hydrogen peroxide-inducible genes activator n=1 Tax=Dasania marina TaxID=471499 RepID=UPI0030DDD8EA|tara:strand:+ start:2281 stop:3180 length:900 start_codon:yes stop_codon:yes gene_type:complete